MKPEDFKESPSGSLMPTAQGAMAFVPNPLPPSGLDLGRLLVPIERATHALGELSGVGRALQNPDLLIRPFSRAEAIASSKIEGTVTTLPELLMLEASADQTKAREDTREVRNYTKALQHGLRRLPNLPLSKRLIQELHAVLLDDVAMDRGARFVPGEFKKDQNWIGARLIQNARYVPPPPAESLSALDALEKYIHGDDETVPILVKLALIHYQFEAIHPFPDGNGRVGRILIPLVLCERGLLSQPLLYVSAFLEKNYDKYIDLMFEVSKSGSWEEWITFFLQAVEFSAQAAVKKSKALQDLQRQHFERIQASARSSVLLGRIINMLFDIPAITIPHAMKELGITYNSAKNNIQRLVDLKILVPRSVHGRPPRPQWFFADEIMTLVDLESGN